MSVIEGEDRTEGEAGTRGARWGGPAGALRSTRGNQHSCWDFQSFSFKTFIIKRKYCIAGIRMLDESGKKELSFAKRFKEIKRGPKTCRDVQIWTIRKSKLIASKGRQTGAVSASHGPHQQFLSEPKMGGGSTVFVWPCDWAVMKKSPPQCS